MSVSVGDIKWLSTNLMIASIASGSGSSGAPVIDVASGKVLGISSSGISKGRLDQVAYAKFLRTIDSERKPYDFELPEAITGVVRLRKNFFEEQALVPLHAQIESLKAQRTDIDKCSDHFKRAEIAGQISNSYVDIFRSNERETLIFIRDGVGFYKVKYPQILSAKPASEDKILHFRVKLPNARVYLIQQTHQILRLVPEFMLLSDDQNIKTDQLYFATEMTSEEVEISRQMALGAFNKFIFELFRKAGVYSNDPPSDSRLKLKDVMQNELLKPNATIPQVTADCTPLMVPNVRDLWSVVTK